MKLGVDFFVLWEMFARALVVFSVSFAYTRSELPMGFMIGIVAVLWIWVILPVLKGDMLLKNVR